MNIKEKATPLVLGAVIAGSVAVGAVGGTMLSALGTHAQTPASTPAAAPSNGGAAQPSGGTQASPGSQAAPGTFKSNEDSAHEAKESPQREAQEDAGQRPTVP